MENTNLELEISKLKSRLDKAIIFEVGPGLSIGVSEEDDLWRIRRDVDEESFVFLNKSGIWENPPNTEDTLFADRTGFEVLDEAFSAFDNYATDYGSNNNMIFDIVSSHSSLQN
jgi:hypothetical protein